MFVPLELNLHILISYALLVLHIEKQCLYNFEQYGIENNDLFCNIYREAFGGFDPNFVAKMGEKEITDITSNKAIMVAESRVRCILDNAKCILKASLKLLTRLHISSAGYNNI